MSSPLADDDQYQVWSCSCPTTLPAVSAPPPLPFFPGAARLTAPVEAEGGLEEGAVEEVSLKGTCLMVTVSCETDAPSVRGQDSRISKAKELHTDVESWKSEQNSHFSSLVSFRIIHKG